MRPERSSQAEQLRRITGLPATGVNAAACDRQDVTEHAILLSQSERGWRWQVIDSSGVSVARGLSADQSEAMGCAQRAIDFCGAASAEAMAR
jgi:hypothetical protein